MMESFKVVSAVELQCEHSNKTSSAVLSSSTICFSAFYKMKYGIFVLFDFNHFWGCKGLFGLVDAKEGPRPGFDLVTGEYFYTFQIL